MQSEKPMISEIPGDECIDTIKCHQVTIKKDRFKKIANNYKGLIYFASRITDIPMDKLLIGHLRNFEENRFKQHECYIKNHSFPVDYYLDRIDELEKEIRKLKTEDKLHER